MATRTISNAGGNYNATATWVEAAVPTSADDVVATATSGQLTVNVASAARNFNFTNYTNTLTMNNTWTVSGTGFTNTFVSAMTISGTSFITLTNTNTIVTNGKSIPNLSLSGTSTLGDDLNVVNFNNGGLTLNGGGFNLNISGNTSPSFNVLTNGLTGTLTINFNGTNQNLRNNFAASSNAAAPQFTINYVGVQYNANGSGSGLQITGGNSTTRPVINYISGSFSTGYTFYTSIENAGWALNFGSASSAGINNFFLRGSSANQTLELLSDLSVMNLAVSDMTSNAIIYTITGTGRILAENTSIYGNFVNATGLMSSRSFTLNLTPGATHSFGSLIMLGIVDDNAVIKSTITNGAKAAFSVGNVQSVFRGSFTDCEVVGSPLYVLDSALLRTTNITQLPQYYYSAGGTGSVAGGSFTFVN
jgi:hypothetical protein